MAATAISTAIKEIIRAAQDLISGQKFRRRSASHKHSQCGGEPGAHPPVACANCAKLIFLNSLGYPLGTDGVSEDMLVTYEKVAEEYRRTMSVDGVIPEVVLRRNLTPQAYLSCFAVPDLVAEIRRLRTEKELA